MSDAASIAILFLLAHLVGDYVVQTEWMATEKTSRWSPAIAHGLTYGACYLAVTRDPAALAVIAGTHIVFDHYRIAKWIVWAKNQVAPKAYRYPWASDARGDFGERAPIFEGVVRRRRPEAFARNFWLMIILDNTCHLLINYAALRWL